MQKCCWIHLQGFVVRLMDWRSSPQCSTALRCQRGAETQSSMITINKGARLGLRLHEKGGKEHAMPVHPLLETDT